jgi:hypothetical protein
MAARQESLSLAIIDDIMCIAVRPYLGHEAALEELSTSASHRAA